MKKIKILLLICLIFPVFIAGCTCNSSVYVVQREYENAEKYLVGNQTYSNVTNIDLEWLAGDITIIQSTEDDKVIIKEDVSLNDKKRVHSYFKDGTLLIKYWQSGLDGNIKSDMKNIVITIPVIDNLILHTSNGNIVSKDIKVNQSIDISQLVGGVNIKSIDCPDIKISAGNNKVNIEKINANNLKVTAYSDIKLNELNVNNSTIYSSRGNVDVTFVSAQQAKVSTFSGNSTIKIPDEGAIIKSKGTFQSQREYTVTDDGYVIGTGDMVLELSSSGNNIIK